MKKVIRMFKERDYNSVYLMLKDKEYKYTLDNFVKDFRDISSIEKFCYLVYLLSNDYSVNNILLICDFLFYTDTFFYDVHSVIRMIIKHAMQEYHQDTELLKWITMVYENHPDSPFDESEMEDFNELLIQLS